MNGIELKAKRKKMGLTQVQLAERTGIPKSTIGRIEADGSAIKKVVILEKLDKIFKNEESHNNITLREKINQNENILNEPATEYRVTKIIEGGVEKGTPMFSSAATASEVEVYDDMLNDGPAFFVNIPQFRDCSFGKMVFGHSMYPTYESGTYIFCKPVTDKHTIAPGEVYYIEIDNFAYCKRLQLSDAPGEYMAESDNEEIRKDGLRKYRTFPIKIDKIRQIYLVKGHFKQSQN